LVNTSTQYCAGEAMSRKPINIGNQSNDGTGDSIRDAFSKTNDNFTELYAVAGLGNGLRFTNLADAPRHLSGRKIITTDATGLTLTQLTLATGTGISITYDYPNAQLVISNSASALHTDSNPYLGGDLSGVNTYRAINFANPTHDQDLVTRRWLYDNFLNRDGNYVTESGQPPVVNTAIEGSTLRHNVQLIPATGTNFSFNDGKTISIYTATGSSSTIDLSLQASIPSHLTRKDYVDSKISLQGTETIDPATGEINPGFGQMTGPLYLSRDPLDSDGGLIAATKHYVDNNGYYSANNLYVTSKGRDYQPEIPAYKRGRFYQYAFASLNKAAQYAEELINASKIEVGDYARLITYDNGTPCTVNSVTDNYASSGLSRLVLEAGILGSDQFGSVETGKFTIYPGQYIQGISSKAIGLIEGIATGGAGEEVYTIEYVDYAVHFATDVTASIPDYGNLNQVLFTFSNPKIVPIPDFWVGYKFYVDTASVPDTIVVPDGTIIATQSVANELGIYTDAFLVDFGSDYSALEGLVFTNRTWHVYSGDFIPGETVEYNTDVSSMQISFIVESGEYYEQLPIKLSANTSIRGDEFRRVIIRPDTGVSTSPWATTHFRRDTQIDGLQIAPLDTSFNYATTGTIATATASPNGSSGDISVTLSTGTISSSYKNYMFVGNGGQGVITACNGSSFTVTVDHNGMANTDPIATGDWQIYKPVNFGYHYLRDPSKIINVLTTQTNAGGFIKTAKALAENKVDIQNGVVTYIQDTYPLYSFDVALCFRDAGTMVDSLITDITMGGSGNTMRLAAGVATFPSLTTGQCADGIRHINTLGQAIIAGIEPGADVILADLIQAAARIINLDADFNPPKLNTEMDMFLMNDATILRYISCQGHGGFMKVLDPAGQIKNKSPYTQTCSSFSQSVAKQAFRGGMFVDGFTGNLEIYPTTNTFASPLRIPVDGLVRRPEVPSFFVHNGIRYEVDFLSNFVPDAVLPNGTQTYAATLNLNPLTPGGLAVTGSNIVTVTDTVGGFKPNQTNIPITVDAPNGVGGITATGHAVSNGLGRITNVIIDFPGTGYIATPTIAIGGAVINNLQLSSGNIIAATIAYGGAGYAVGCAISIEPQGTTGITTATATVSSVDSNGKITGISMVYAGDNWTAGTNYKVYFGDATINVPTPIAGFVDIVPNRFELVTAGNRSMLANDFTQVNDLGYGIFVTNGGFAENVSMFTYYCYRSYYALNGSQVRSTTGSSCYGEYGLTAEGSDPNEVPINVNLSYPLTQIATAYVAYPLFPAIAGQTSIYVEVDPSNGGFPALGSSQIEINHNGIIRTYSIGAAVQALDAENNVIPNVYQLSFNSGNLSTSSQVGLLEAVANGAAVTCRAEGLHKFYGINPDTLSRPSTVLTMDDDPTKIYHVTNYSTVQSDNAVFVYTLEDYNYVAFQSIAQGVTYPKLTNGGTGYTTATVSISSASILLSETHNVFGDQGSALAGVQTIEIDNISYLSVGMTVSGNAITTGTTLTYINSATVQIGLSIPTTGMITSGTVLTFTGTVPTAHAVITSGTVTSIVIDNPGTGWTGTSTGITITGDGASAAVTTPINLAGVVGSRTIKVTPLSLPTQSRIDAGLAQSPPKYYQFGVNGQLLNIVAYRSISVTGQTWAEIDLDQALTRAITEGTTLYAGVAGNSSGKVTTRLSLLRVTGHDFVDIGTGGYATTRIPNDLYGPPVNKPQQIREVNEKGAARVYYATTDQDGNFRVGTAFTVNQAQGSVTINAPIDLSNLSSVSLKKDLGPPVSEFSTDNTMVTEADYKVPTEQATANYINRRLGLNRDGNLYAGALLSGGGFVAVNGKMAMKADLNLASHHIINLADPQTGHAGDGANKGYVDQRIERRGISALDTDGTTPRPDFGIMTGLLQLSRDPIATDNPLTAATRNYVDANNTTTITNTKLANSGGSDFTITRSTTSATYKLVGGKGVNNPITDYHINDNAGINVNKLSTSTISGVQLGNNLYGLTIGTGLSGSTYNGTAGVTIASTGILSITAGTGVGVTAGQNTTLSIGQDVGTTTTPTFAGITVQDLFAGGAGSTATVHGVWSLADGSSFESTYADLAEFYSADAEYDPGTVLVFGGNAEVTTTNEVNDSRVAGAVTTNPSYTLNASQEGTRACIALQGRVPVKVIGVVAKGDLLTTSSTPGYACKATNPQVGTIIGKALENKNTLTRGVIEVAIGRN